MKKNTPEIIILLLLAIPFFVALASWNQLPNQMAVHFNLNGSPDRTGTKAEGLLTLPIVNLLIYLLLKFLPRFFMAKEQFALFEKRYIIIRMVIHCFVTALYILIVMYTLNHHINVLLFIAYGLLMVFLIIGNYLNNIQPNYFIGIRTPWTMNNAVVWRKTHHLTARLWVAASLLVMCIIPFVSQLHLSLLLLLYFFIIIIFPIIYSFIISKQP
jgi:uncharacterized membrane protein